MRVMFHVHTRYSKDSLLPLRLLRWMCRLKKLDGICITDHNEIDGALAFQKRYETPAFRVIAGEEIFTAQGEIIGLYLTRKIPAGLPVDETIRQIREQGGLVIVPHPYEIERGKTVLDAGCIAAYKDEIDAMECFNGRNFKEAYSAVQNRMCEEYRIPKILGADAHTFYEIGKNVMAIDGDMTKKSFLENLPKATFYPKHMPKIVHYVTKGHKLVKLLTGKFK